MGTWCVGQCVFMFDLFYYTCFSMVAIKGLGLGVVGIDRTGMSDEEISKVIAAEVDVQFGRQLCSCLDRLRPQR